MNFRQAIGKQVERLETGIEKNFSNFLHVDRYYGSNLILRRIFSLARKHGYQSLLTEEISEADCALLASENQTLAARRSDFHRSEVRRISFFRSPTSQAPAPSDFIGYVILAFYRVRGLSARNTRNENPRPLSNGSTVAVTSSTG